MKPSLFLYDAVIGKRETRRVNRYGVPRCGTDFQSIPEGDTTMVHFSFFAVHSSRVIGLGGTMVEMACL